MSVNAEVFLIIGLDVEPYLMDKFKDWKWTKEGEKYTDYRREEQIQFIEDGMNGLYTYFGYIVSNIDEMYGNYHKEIPEMPNDITSKVDNKLIELVNLGILKSDVLRQNLKTILFTHCS